MRSLGRCALLLNLFALLVTAGCSAQSQATQDPNRRIERLVRTHFNIPPSVEIKTGERRTSTEFPGYETVKVTLSRGERSTTHEFLVAKDGKLLQMVAISDPMEKIDLAGRPFRGAKDAKVVLVNYDYFQCQFCARNHQALFSDILKSYGDRVRFIYKDYPLAEIHPWATRAAIDSNCLAAQSNDAYWSFADYAHANQGVITGKNRPPAEQWAALDKAAEDAGHSHSLDMTKLAACLKAQPDAAVRASVREADGLGVSATPTMFVNGQKIDGAASVEQLRAYLDRALTDAGQAAPPKSESKPAAPAP